MPNTRQVPDEQPSLFGAKIVAAFFLTYPTVGKFIDDGFKDLISLRITYRGPGDYLAIAKRYSSSGDVQVIFGSGHTWYGCLGGLEVAMEQGKWRQDKWNTGGKKEKG